jgi:uncharacterized membrane protein
MNGAQEEGRSGMFGGIGMVGMVGMLVMAVAWVGLVLLVIWSVGQLFPRERRSHDAVAREVLQHRYAAGEISESEYRQALRALGYD